VLSCGLVLLLLGHTLLLLAPADMRLPCMGHGVHVLVLMRGRVLHGVLVSCSSCMRWTTSSTLLLLWPAPA
jgi:hypothetical protein